MGGGSQSGEGGHRGASWRKGGTPEEGQGGWAAPCCPPRARPWDGGDPIVGGRRWVSALVGKGLAAGPSRVGGPRRMDSSFVLAFPHQSQNAQLAYFSSEHPGLRSARRVVLGKKGKSCSHLFNISIGMRCTHKLRPARDGPGHGDGGGRGRRTCSRESSSGGTGPRRGAPGIPPRRLMAPFSPFAASIPFAHRGTELAHYNACHHSGGPMAPQYVGFVATPGPHSTRNMVGGGGGAGTPPPSGGDKTCTQRLEALRSEVRRPRGGGRASKGGLGCAPTDRGP